MILGKYIGNFSNLLTLLALEYTIISQHLPRIELNMGNQEKTNCLMCNKEIDLYKSSVNRKNGKIYLDRKKINKYCSLECAGKSRRIDSFAECPQCHSEFKLLYKDQKVFCSQSCSGKFNQSCKKVRSWEYVDKTKPKKTPKRKGRLCEKCGANTKKNKFCDLCKHEKELNRAKTRYQTRKRAIHIMKSVLIHLSGGCCCSCGYKGNQSSLVFHHRDPKEKLFTLDVSTIMKKDIEAVLQEHSKCDLMCHNCHADLHNEERNVKISKKYAYRRRKYIDRKLKYINECGGICKNCNRVFIESNIQSASFHHTRDKEFELNCNAFISKSREEIRHEGEKCVLLCLNCHLSIPK